MTKPITTLLACCCLFFSLHAQDVDHSLKGEKIPCAEGKAAGFECDNVDLISFLSAKEMGGTEDVTSGDLKVIINDMWGWYDEEEGKEYALVGRINAMTFIDVTNPYNPIYLGELPLTDGAKPNFWRDVKVYKNHAYIVADNAGEHGVQIFDLTRLRNVENPPVTFTEDAHYDKIASAHNIVINEGSGYAFVVGASGGGETCGGGLHMINIRKPTEPEFAGCFSDTNTGNQGTGYSHDAQCIIYHGPDHAYQGHEICFGANENALSIGDVTDKENPTAVSSASYPKVAYAHQGWVSEDHRHFYLNDEGDEFAEDSKGTRTLVWDITDLDDPQLVKEFIHSVKSSDHNYYVKGNYMYQSNYDSGLRILNIADPANPVEVGHFDTVPGENKAGFRGSWSNYPYFRSGVVGFTSMGEGFFLVKFQEVDI